jgi:hypothetical protein
MVFALTGRVSALDQKLTNRVPISGAPLTITATPATFPTDLPTDGPTGGPPLSLTLMLVFTGCALSLVLGILVLGFVLATQNRKFEKKEKGKKDNLKKK